MKARAPGKVVISGAYSVLEGAPAIVSAVSRYAVADSSRPADMVTPEVRTATGAERAPWFDASALRGPRGKLGLGSSAAILVASLAALALERDASLAGPALGRAVLEPALQAHRAAQGGGSGVDVIASALGGSVMVQRIDGELAIEHVELPKQLCFEIWAGGKPASTSELVGRVMALRRTSPAVFSRAMDPLRQAAERARAALTEGAASDFVAALASQYDGLARLGEAAGVPIVTPEVAELSALAKRAGSVVLPSGAGGGDVALYVGFSAPSAELVRRRSELDHERLDCELGAQGVHAIDSSSARSPST